MSEFESRDALSFDAILDERAHSEPNPEIPEEDRDLVAELDRKFDKAYDSKAQYENDWEFHRLYLKGEQLVARNRDTGEVVRITERDAKRLRSMNNYLRPTARSLVGKMTRTIPTCGVIPATADFVEQHGARVADALLRYFQRCENLNLKWLDAHEYIPWAGNAFFHLYWDRFRGQKLAYCEVCDYTEKDEELVGQPCPQCAQQKEQEAMAQQQADVQQKQMIMNDMLAQLPPGVMPSPDMIPQDLPPPPMQQLGPLPLEQEVPELIEVYEGAVRVAVRDPRHVYVEAGAESIEAAQWVCVRYPLPVPEIRRMFPEFAPVIHREDNMAIDRTAEARYNTFGSDIAVDTLDDHAYVWEFYEKPTSMYPKGRTIYRVNDMIVRRLDGQEGRPENIYWSILGRHPLYHIGFDKNQGELWREPYLAQSWHRQREINRIETQMREHVELGLKPRLFIPIGSRVNTDEITAHTDQLIKYNPAAGPPIPVTFPSLPRQVEERRQQLMQDIKTQSGVTDQDLGISPTDPNGRAMAIIEAESDQQMGPILTRNFTEWRELHRGMLQLFQALASPETKWSIPGEESVQVYSFDELILNPGWDIELDQEDGMSRNPAIRLRQGMELLQAGVFTDPMTGQPDIKAFMRHVKVKVPQTGYDLEKTERAAASQVPYLLEQGEQHQPQPENDPMIYAEELLGWLRGPGRKKVKDNPQLVEQVREIWKYYVSWTQMGVPPDSTEAQQMMQQQTQQQAGAPQGGGGQAQQQVQQADQQAEGQARMQQNHEG